MLARLLALLVSAVSAVGVWLTWRVFVSTSTGQVIEEAALAGATYGQTRLWRLAEPLLDIVSQSFLVAGIAVLVVIAALRRRWTLGVQAVVLVGGANLTTQLLKRGILDRPALGGDVGGATLPSGHTTVAASLAAALVVVAPRWARPWVAVLGALYTAATGVSTLIGQWHRPSDAIAAVLVVLAWAAVVCGLGPASASDPAPRPEVGRTAGSARVAGSTLEDSALRGSGSGVPGSRAPESGVPGSGVPGRAAPESRSPSRAPTPALESPRAPRSVGTAPAAVILLIGTLVTALPAGWGYAEAFRDARAGAEIGTVATYIAGAFAVSAVCAAAFVLLLLVRQSTARPPNG